MTLIKSGRGWQCERLRTFPGIPSIWLPLVPEACAPRTQGVGGGERERHLRAGRRPGRLWVASGWLLLWPLGLHFPSREMEIMVLRGPWCGFKIAVIIIAVQPILVIRGCYGLSTKSPRTHGSYRNTGSREPPIAFLSAHQYTTFFTVCSCLKTPVRTARVCPLRSPNPQRDGLRACGLWEGAGWMSSAGWGRTTGAESSRGAEPKAGSTGESAPRESSSAQARKRAVAPPRVGGAWVLDSRPPELREIRVCWLSAPVCGIVVTAASAKTDLQFNTRSVTPFTWNSGPTAL